MKPRTITYAQLRQVLADNGVVEQTEIYGIPADWGIRYFIRPRVGGGGMYRAVIYTGEGMQIPLPEATNIVGPFGIDPCCLDVIGRIGK